MNSVFKNRNFALVFFGALVTNIGSLFYSFTVSTYWKLRIITRHCRGFILLFVVSYISSHHFSAAL